MSKDAAILKSALCRTIDEKRDEIIGLLRQFLRIRSVNPPGDMREAAAFVRTLLDGFGVPHRTVALKDSMPNIIGRWDAGAAGRHLVLNGHMDVFPVTDERLWNADIVDGRIMGRGASDMKTGTLAAILTYCYLYPYRAHLTGALTLTVVSDEQSGGRYGTKYLFDAFADEIAGDCCLNGEPSGLANIRFTEKGTLRFSLSAQSAGGHGGYPHRAPNPIEQICKLIAGIYERYHLKLATLPADIDAILASPESVAAADANLGAGAADNARRITVNAGIIEGGRKATQIPTGCIAHIDIRFPIGSDRDVIRADIEALAADHGCAMVVNEDHSYPASITDPFGEMATILRGNIKDLLGHEAPPVCSLGGTDTRYWRWRNIPAIICGPSPISMGTDDEHVTVDEAIAVVKLQAMCAVDYMTGAGNPHQAEGRSASSRRRTGD
ncbi:M20/M25/M40 family metallo-hydrolase [Limobrevibacterium gyesilva]|uniref:M20/M25/M40 family metallo-hydrolase n=1 Tax=Limobrevibacterium gyesilva TaxID=2991712 RepID=A0AA41YTZ4_9PROT|nr:M20/M25/M40 family metallo-hydrolase [Limobrevibacterium gyesilva]MCW3476528.1 M20/M25/M40 family metallo-hydrolase [Limobrevibacterium gyesilva]